VVLEVANLPRTPGPLSRSVGSSGQNLLKAEQWEFLPMGDFQPEDDPRMMDLHRIYPQLEESGGCHDSKAYWF